MEKKFQSGTIRHNISDIAAAELCSVLCGTVAATVDMFSPPQPEAAAATGAAPLSQSKPLIERYFGFCCFDKRRYYICRAIFCRQVLYKIQSKTDKQPTSLLAENLYKKPHNFKLKWV